MHVCDSKLIPIGSDNGLPPDWHQAIIWTNAGMLLIWPLGTNLSEILIKNSYIFIRENVFENVVWKMAAILSPPQCVDCSGRCYLCDVFSPFLNITWESWRQWSLANQLFIQQAFIKGNIEAVHYWTIMGGIHRWPVDGFSAQRTSNAESISMLWGHH